MNKFQSSATLLSLLGSSLAFAQVSISPTIPSGTGVIANSTQFGTTPSRIFDIDSNNNHARGNRFFLANSGGTTFRIDSVTLQTANGNQVFNNDTFTLYLYQGTSAQFNTGTGHTTALPGDPEDFYEGTTVTPLTSEAFVLSETIATGQYITLQLTTPIVVAENSDYGFFFTYDQGDGALTNFSYQESGTPPNADDGRTSITTTSHGTAGSRQMDYWIQGEAIDPGIADSTLSLSDTLISTGTEITLDITFDPTVDTALLSTVPASTTTDLKLLDDGITNGDLVAGDGIVSILSGPLTTSLSYQIDVARTGQTSETVTVDVIVVDPSAVPDTALSSAILADSPAFYYRFEEPVDAGYAIDYSGNEAHADEFVGTLVQGTSSSGVGNALQLNGDGGIRTPVSRDMSLPFTFTAIVDPDQFPSTDVRNILSNADGGAGRVGRSVFHTRVNGLGTEISGATINVADTNITAPERAVLLHMVSDPAGPDGREARIYLNGILYSTTAIGAVGPNAGDWILGANLNLTDNYFDGLLDEAAMFHSILSDVQIAAHGDAFLGLATDPFLGFVADSSEAPIGVIGTNLNIMVSNAATGVTLDGATIDITGGAGNYIVPVTSTTVGDITYNLEVTGPGGPFTQSVTVTFVAPPGPPVITDCSASDDTPPMFTINFTGTPDTSYVVVASSDLDFVTNPEVVFTATTDASGVGIATFEGLGESEFYRLELP